MNMRWVSYTKLLNIKERLQRKSRGKVKESSENRRSSSDGQMKYLNNILKETRVQNWPGGPKWGKKKLRPNVWDEERNGPGSAS